MSRQYITAVIELRRWRSALLCLTLCSGLIEAPNALAEGAFGGVYRGSKRAAMSSNDGGCVVGTFFDTVTVVIKNNHFVRPDGDVVLSVDVTADGSFHADGMGMWGKLREIKGKITGDSFEADQGSPYCIWHLSLKRS